MSLRLMVNLGILSLALFPCRAQGEKSKAEGSLNTGPGEVAVTGILRLNDHQGIIEIYNQLLEKEPANIEYLLARARAKFKTGDRQGGLTDIQAAQLLVDRDLQKQPKNPSLHAQKALAFRLLGDYPSAMAQIKKAIYLDPNREEFHRDMRLIQSEMSEHSPP